MIAFREIDRKRKYVGERAIVMFVPAPSGVFSGE
jgi:hypothetical protein